MEGAGQDAAWGSLTRLTAPRGRRVATVPRLQDCRPRSLFEGGGAVRVPGTGHDEAVHSRTPVLLRFRVELPPCHLRPEWRRRLGQSIPTSEPGRTGSSDSMADAGAERS